MAARGRGAGLRGKSRRINETAVAAATAAARNRRGIRRDRGVRGGSWRVPGTRRGRWRATGRRRWRAGRTRPSPGTGGARRLRAEGGGVSLGQPVGEGNARARRRRDARVPERESAARSMGSDRRRRRRPRLLFRIGARGGVGGWVVSQSEWFAGPGLVGGLMGVAPGILYSGGAGGCGTRRAVREGGRDGLGSVGRA